MISALLIGSCAVSANMHASAQSEQLAGTPTAATNSPDPAKQAQRANLLKIVEQCDESISKNPKDFKAFVDRAHAFYELGNYGLCAQDLTWALQLDSSDPRWYVWRGKAYAKSGNNDGALSDFNKALAANPKYTQALLERGNLYLALKQQDKALADFSAVIAAEPQNEAALEKRAEIYKALGKISLAEKDLTAAINSTPKAKYLIARSNVTKDSQPQAALNDVSSALEMDPKNPTALDLRATIFGKLKYSEKALDDLNAAINLSPLDMSLVFKRAHAYIRAKQWDKALTDLQNCLIDDPNNSNYYLARAYVYHKQGNELLSEQDVKRAQFCNPTLPQNINFDGADAKLVTQN